MHQSQTTGKPGVHSRPSGRKTKTKSKRSAVPISRWPASKLHHAALSVLPSPLLLVSDKPSSRGRRRPLISDQSILPIPSPWTPRLCRLLVEQSQQESEVLLARSMRSGQPNAQKQRLLSQREEVLVFLLEKSLQAWLLLLDLVGSFPQLALPNLELPQPSRPRPPPFLPLHHPSSRPPRPSRSQSQSQIL